MQSCEEWLKDRLKDRLKDWSLVDDVRAEAKAQGFTRGQLKEARRKLGVETFHQFDEEGSTPNWFWRVKQ